MCESVWATDVLNFVLAYQMALAVLDAAAQNAQAAAQTLAEAARVATGATAALLWLGKGRTGTDEEGLYLAARSGPADVECGATATVDQAPEDAALPLTPAPCPESDYAYITLPVEGGGRLKLIFRRQDEPNRALLEVLAPLVRRLGVAVAPPGTGGARHAWLEDALENAGVGIYVLQDGRFRYVNRRFAEMFGYAAAELEGRPYLDVIAEDDRPLVAGKVRAKIDGCEPLTVYSFRGRRKDGSLIYVEVTSSRTTFGGRPAVHGTMVDLTGYWQKEQALRAHLDELSEMTRRLKDVNLRLLKAQRLTARLARTDPLTKLANRRAFARELHKACRHALRTGKPLTVLVLDLDNLKTVNDRFGHQKGDAVLVQAAELLRSELRQKDVVARIGGDEFAVLLPGVDASQGARIADRIRQRSREVLTAMTGIPVGFSVGLASACGDADPDRLLAAADSAMYEDKHKKH